MSLKPAPMIKAYSYVRFSTPEQARGDSLRRQIAAAEEYATQHGLELDTSLRDLGVSGYTGANKKADAALGSFKAAIERGEVARGSLLIVESLDRLSRETVLQALSDLTGLIRAGITVVTLFDKQSYSEESLGNEWTRLILGIAVMARAHEESRTKSDRVAKAWGAKRERAALDGGSMTRQCVAWCHIESDGKGKRPVLVPERAALVRRIFELTASGHGHRLIAVRFNTEGVPVWGRSKGWQPSYICKILASRAVLGFYQPHVKARSAVRRIPEGPEIAGYYPPAVDEALYYKALAARAARRHKGGRKGKGLANILSGLAKCASCGQSMTFQDKGGPPKGGKYLVCDGRVRGMGCEDGPRWRYDVAEKAVLSRVGIKLAEILGRVPARTDGVATVAEVADKLAALEGRRNRLIAGLGDVKDPAVMEVLRAAAEDVAVAGAELKAAELAGAMARHGAIDLPDRNALLKDLGDRMGTAEGDELVDLRTRLAQELKRVLIRLSFTPTNILADYKVDPARKRTIMNVWTAGIPLLDTGEGRDEDEASDAEEYFRRTRRRMNSGTPAG